MKWKPNKALDHQTQMVDAFLEIRQIWELQITNPK